jgi:phenylacetate-CoA ligase
MSLYQKAVAGILFPIQEHLKGHHTMAIHRAMDDSQWFSPEEISAVQVQNLRRFLMQIGDKVPYYRELFAELGFDPQGVTDIAALQALPLLDKPTIRANCDSMTAEDANNLKHFNTGGSSGEPLIFYLGKERVSHDVAAKRRATRWWGVDIGDKEIVLWGSPIELGAQDRARLMRDRLFRTELLSAFDMSRENLRRFIERIESSRPKMLFGYPSSLALLAEYAIAHKKRLDHLGIRVVFVTSECLYDQQRQVIETAFGCPVANGYGGRDAGFIAHQCPEGSFHMTAEDMVVEIVDGAGRVLPAGETGEIVVTHLFTSEFPFVRYRTGDVGALAANPCVCGRGLPVLASLEGRTTDFVTASNGTVLHGLALIYVLRDMPGVEAFRIIQESLHHTRVELVTDKRHRITLKESIQKPFRQRLGQDVDISIDYLDAIPREESGKYRYVVSKLKQDVAG